MENIKTIIIAALVTFLANSVYVDVTSFGRIIANIFVFVLCMIVLSEAEEKFYKARR